LKNNKILLLLAFSFILFTASAYGQAPAIQPDTAKKKEKIGSMDLENGFERYFFYTKYQIGGKTLTRSGVGFSPFPLSELKFPMNALMAYINLDLNLLDRITARFNMKKNVHNRVGKMEDSDWVPYPGLKTIYSKSDARLNAVITENDLIVRLFTISFFSLKLGAGFMYQHLYYWCSNVTQYSSISVDAVGNINFNPNSLTILGKSITYLVRYYITTLQIIPVFTIQTGSGTLDIATSLRFSPYLKARDTDDHIMRGKKSEGDSEGYALMPSLVVRYLFSNGIFITAAFDYLYLETQGTQVQSYYSPFLENPGSLIVPGWSANIQNRLKSEQLSVSLGAGYSFEFRAAY
jgi:outer membrane protease